LDDFGGKDTKGYWVAFRRIELLPNITTQLLSRIFILIQVFEETVPETNDAIQHGDIQVDLAPVVVV